ncbi:MAG: hypothetical protein AAF416_20700 [Pseudomonadota bacterium]
MGSPTTVLTKQQEAWTKAVQKKLGLKSDQTSVTEDQTEETVELKPEDTQDKLETKPESEKDQYGKAMKEKGLFDGDAPGPLKDALAADPKVLISKEKWKAVSDKLVDERKDFMADYENKKKAVLAVDPDDFTIKNKPIERMKAALPILDAPENNPEREEIGERLDEIANVTNKIKALPTPVDQKDLETLSREKMRLMNALGTEIGAWMNRRTEQHLPPPREAVALNDLLQQEHRAMIKTFLDRGWSPPPVADQDSMTKEELDQLKKTWDDLVDPVGSGCGVQIRGAVPATTAPEYSWFRSSFDDLRSSTGRTTDPSAEEMKAFRIEMLSAMAKLLGTKAGRNLFAEYEKTGHKMYLVPGEDYACVRGAGSKAKATSNPDDPEPISPGGGDTGVEIPMGEVDSNSFLCTEDGNLLFDPVFSGVGHEMTHALHNAQGINRRDIPIRTDVGSGKKEIDDNKWNNYEEYWTIRKGEISEQTIRNDYGLSALRFGHSSTAPTRDLGKAALDQVLAAKKYADLNTDEKVDKKLKERGWDPKQLNDTLRVALYEDGSETKGPLPSGWIAVRLNLDQIKGIVGDKLPFRMKRLNWTAYNLPYKDASGKVMGFPESLKEITEAHVQHPRSGPGRRFRGFGGEAVFAKMKDCSDATGIPLGKWNETDWRANLRSLSAAEKQLNAMIKGNDVISGETEASRKVTETDKLETKCERVAAILTHKLGSENAKAAGLYLADDALARFGCTETTDMAKQIAFLKGKETDLAKREKVLTEAGHSISGLSLVARLDAVEAYEKIRDDERVAQCKRLMEISLTSLGEDKMADAVDFYGSGRELFAALTDLVNAVTPASLGETIRGLLLAPMDRDLSKQPRFGHLAVETSKASASAWDKLLEGTPGRAEVFTNVHGYNLFLDHLKTVDGGKTLWDFRTALGQRYEARIEELAEGDALVKSGVKTYTLVALRKDPADEMVVTAAISDVDTVLDELVKTFVEGEKVAKTK